MHYNYDFEMAAVVCMGVIFIHFLCSKQFPSKKTSVFRGFLICCMVQCVTNIGSSICVEHAQEVPLFVNELFAFLAFFLEVVSGYLFFYYALLVCNIKGKSYRVIDTISKIYFGIGLLLVVITPITGFYYYFDADKNYVSGVGSYFGYAYFLGFFLTELMLLIFRYKYVRPANRIIILVYTIGTIAASIFQAFNRGTLTIGLAWASTILLMYLSIQNPSEYVDFETQAGNENALLMQMQKFLEKEEPFSAIVINIRKQSYLDILYGLEKETKLKELIGNYLRQVCGKFHVFKMSADTFYVLVVDKEEADKDIAEIRERFLKPWKVDEIPVPICADIFLLSYPDHFSDFISLRGISDYLIGQILQGSSAQMICADESYKKAYERTRLVERALDKALTNRSLQVYFQPIFSVEEQKITALEALVRLEDEEVGFIAPDEFIGIAEKNGKILELGMQVFEECSRFIAESILPHPELGIENININVSAIQCMQPDMAERMISIIEKYQIPPGMISLEVTEQTAIIMPELMRQHMKRLHDLGINFALDDYGTGNANCSYLINMQFQKVKFDKGLIWSYFEKETARVILQNEFETLKKLGIPIVAEGVEEQMQYDVLKEQGIEYIQGYYFGRPLPQRECLTYINNYNNKNSAKEKKPAM